MKNNCCEPWFVKTRRTATAILVAIVLNIAVGLVNLLDWHNLLVAAVTLLISIALVLVAHANNRYAVAMRDMHAGN